MFILTFPNKLTLKSFNLRGFREHFSKIKVFLGKSIYGNETKEMF